MPWDRGQIRGLLMIAPELEESAPGVLEKEAAAASRKTIRRAARRRQEEMTEPCEEGLGVLLAESVQQGNRPVSRELLPLPIPISRKRARGKRAAA